MQTRPKLTLDMTPDGQFRQPPKPSLAGRVLFVAVGVAILAGAASVAALALWFALALIPIAAGAALVAYLAIRYRLWRARSTLFRGQGNLYRP